MLPTDIVRAGSRRPRRLRHRSSQMSGGRHPKPRSASVAGFDPLQSAGRLQPGSMQCVASAPAAIGRPQLQRAAIRSSVQPLQHRRTACRAASREVRTAASGAARQPRARSRMHLRVQPAQPADRPARHLLCATRHHVCPLRHVQSRRCAQPSPTAPLPIAPACCRTTTGRRTRLPSPTHCQPARR